MFTLDGPILRLCTWIYRCVCASLLCFGVSLLVVTIPLGVVGMYAVLGDRLPDGRSPILPLFLQGMRRYGRQSLWLGLMMVASGLLLALDYAVLREMRTPLAPIVLGALWLSTALWVCMGLYVFVLAVRVPRPTRALLLLGFKMTFYRLDLTLLNLVGIATLLYVTWIFPSFLWMFAPAAAASLTLTVVDRKLCSM